MEFKLGERFSYNQTNGYLPGKIISKLSGEPFAQEYLEKQFQPVGMRHTLFGDSRDVTPYSAPTYTYRLNIDGQKLDKEQYINNYYEFPYSRRTTPGLNSTAEDRAKWVIALQTGKLLRLKSSLDMMWSPAGKNSFDSESFVLVWRCEARSHKFLKSWDNDSHHIPF